jgi:hypothetical protein
VRELLGKGRLDASGAYIDGVGLTDAQAEPVLNFLTAKGADNAATLTELRLAVGDSPMGAEGISELQDIERNCLPRQATAPTASSSTPPSSGASATTPARSSRRS